MSGRVKVFAVTALIASLAGYAGTSMYAACTLASLQCYKVKPQCPVTQDTNCHYSSNPGPYWWRVSTFYYHYKCESTASSFKRCDVDESSKHNVCAIFKTYASLDNCNADLESTGFGPIVSGDLCSGSNPCD